uniref:Uncharacterized protein n=1 Tax=Setaria viridis TaxID=4556 RepID=A0A4U6VHR7_SETVI|nr:hypothetical protein SEVIR_3G297301v2 [Setaria viridis]
MTITITHHPSLHSKSIGRLRSHAGAVRFKASPARKAAPALVGPATPAPCPARTRRHKQPLCSLASLTAPPTAIAAAVNNK